jgi:hypothetical protein
VEGIVSADVAASGGDTCQADRACGLLTWIGQVDQSESDMCHPCSGDTWNICTDDVEGMYNPYDT